MATHSPLDAQASWHTPLTGAVDVHYDHIGDILYLETRFPYPEQDSELTEDQIVIRWDPDTGVVDRIEIELLSRRSPEDAAIQALPVSDPVRRLIADFLRFAQAA